MRLRLFLLTVGSCCLFACVSQERMQFSGSFTTVKEADLAFPAGTLFSWFSETSSFYDEPLLDDVDLQGLLRDNIEAALVLRGYRIVVRGGEYRVSYVAALERALSDDQIDEYFGINPGLQSQKSSSQSYEKGTVIIDVSDPSTQKSLWRSAMQGYVDLGLSKAARRERVRSVVMQMFSSFPRVK